MRIPRKRRWALALAALVALAGITAAGMSLWYTQALRPYDVSVTKKRNFEVKTGWTGAQVVRSLAQEKIIRSESAALLYLRLHGLGADLKSGVYAVSVSQSTPDIVRHIMSGKLDQKSVTFYPGSTLTIHPNAQKPDAQTISKSLAEIGFDDNTIKAALSAQYTGSLFAAKPDQASLEGLVYGETYFVSATSSSKQVIQRALDEFDAIIAKYDLKAKFAAQGLSLYEGITLASIVQREVSCQGKQLCDDQRVVAQIFLKRLREKMPLGADATFVYAANQAGKTPTVDYDSPYNTRVHTGLPPGPISSPGLGALLAVADPADTEYLYFVSGDDFTNHFAKTYQEHNDNVRRYCDVNCRLP